MKRLLLLFLSSLLYLQAPAQTYAENLSVMLRAQVQDSPAQIKLFWPAHASATGYKVYRKLPSAGSWGSILATVPGSDTSYTDNSVSAGTLYEYMVQRLVSGGNGFGYMVSGINTEINPNKGYLILAVDSTFTTSLAAEIDQLVKDYEADGWFVKRFDINRSNPVPVVKSKILALYNESPVNTRALMLLGHIPVPYSGLMNPDGHPDHYGAWPADVFYGEMTSTWGDVSANDVTATDVRNRNIPGDGKYDEDFLPSDLELQVGRVDFYDLPVFAESETQLMQKYLDKLHAFKTRGFIPMDRALIEDNFTGMAEGFAATGFMNYAPMVGPLEINTGDYTSDLQTGSYLCSYGTGPGTYTSAGSIISSGDFAADSIQSVFTFLFGSYFGDWDTPNNLLRSSLGSGTVLTNAWAGRPHWHIHQMAMGENIGHSARAVQNNSGLYFGSTLGAFNRWIHIALMGDPSLRLHYIAPASNLNVTTMSLGYPLMSWTASTEPVLGYHVFRRGITEDNWQQVTPATPITVTGLGDMTVPANGTYVYMVRAVRVQTTASGTYYNMSLGAVDTITTTTIGITENIRPGFVLYPNPAAHTLNINFDADMAGQALTITNVLGETVYTANINQAAGSTTSIDVSGFSRGIYFVNLNGFTQRLVKS